MTHRYGRACKPTSLAIGALTLRICKHELQQRRDRDIGLAKEATGVRQLEVKRLMLRTFVSIVQVASGLSLAGCSDVSTEPPLPPGVTVVSVRLSPDSVRLDTSATQQFSVVASLSDSTTRVVSGAIFDATGGTINSAGLFKSGATNGLFRVIASHPSAALADTSRVFIQGTVTPPVDPGVVILFSDGFESGAFGFQQNGIRWTDRARVDNTNVIARTGSRSARFLQGTPLGDGSWSELRFGGLPQLTEVFLQFYLYMPSGAEIPSVGPRVRVPFPGGNDKFFRLWANTYGQPPEVGASTWSKPGEIGVLGREYFYSYDNGTVMGMGQGPDPVPPEVPFIIDANKGRWVQVRIRCKVSGPNNRSGVIQMWADGVLVGNDTALHNYPPNGVNNYYVNGYLLGWANSGFPAGQMMYIDDVTISTGGFPN